MTTALLRDLWRRSRLHLILLPTGLTLFAALLLSIIPADATAHRATLGVGILWIAVLCLAVDLLYLAEGRRGEGFDPRHFVLPVSCRRLAVTWLAALAGVMATLYLAGALVLQIWLGMAGPNLGTLLFIAAVMVWLVCLIWLTPQRPARRMFYFLLLPAIFVGPLLPFMPATTPDNPFAVLEQLGFAGLAILTLYLVGAFPVGTWALARHRRGDALPAQRTQHRYRAAPATFSAPFRHSFTALLWLDWKEKGPLIPGLFGLPWLLLLAVGLSGWRSRDEVVNVATAFISAVLFFGPVLVAGIVCRVQEGKIGARLDDLRTLRPTSSAQLAAVYLAHGLLGLALAWGLTGAGALITFTLLGTGAETAAHTVATFLRHTPTADLLPQLALLGFALVLLGWLQIGLLSALFLTGRNTAVTLLVLFPYAIAGALLAFRDAITRLPFEALLPAAPWLLGSAGLLGTFGILALARRKRLLRPRPLAWQAGALVVVLLVMAGYFEAPDSAKAFAILGGAVATLAPWPAASLAVRWNRHR